MNKKTMNKIILLLALLTVSSTISKAEAVYMCEPCPAGYACNNGVKTICPVGTYSQAGASSCTPCPDYQWSDVGATKCNKVQLKLVLFDDMLHYVENWFTMDRFLPPGFLCNAGNFSRDPKDGKGFCTISYKTASYFTKEDQLIFGDCKKFPCRLGSTFNDANASYAIIDPAQKRVELHSISNGVLLPTLYYYDALKW